MTKQEAINYFKKKGYDYIPNFKGQQFDLLSFKSPINDKFYSVVDISIRHYKGYKPNISISGGYAIEQFKEDYEAIIALYEEE